MNNQARIDSHLETIRWMNGRIESFDDLIEQLVADRNTTKIEKAEVLGRIAFLEGKKRSRNPFSGPEKTGWSKGYDSERAETVQACHEP